MTKKNPSTDAKSDVIAISVFGLYIIGDGWHCSMKSKMEKLPHLAGGIGVREQMLFHGTPDEATVRCICHQNFDPRTHGRHGTVYGKGVYFSSSAKYSHQYTQPCPEKSGRRFMFFALVLVGRGR